MACSFYREWRVLKNIGFGGVNTIEFTDKSWIAKESQDKFRFFDEEGVRHGIKRNFRGRRKREENRV